MLNPLHHLSPSHNKKKLFDSECVGNPFLIVTTSIAIEAGKVTQKEECRRVGGKNLLRFLRHSTDSMGYSKWNNEALNMAFRSSYVCLYFNIYIVYCLW